MGVPLDIGFVQNEDIKVPEKLVGLIIGRGGEQITRLRNESGCKIRMAPRTEGMPERVCTLTGTREEINRAKNLVMSIIQQRSRTKSPGIGDMMDKSGGGGGSSGGMSGGPPGGGSSGRSNYSWSGETIKQFQEKSGAKMVVIQDGQSQEQEKSLRITGDPQKVEYAKQLVYDLIAKKEMQRRDKDMGRGRVRGGPNAGMGGPPFGNRGGGGGGKYGNKGGWDRYNSGMQQGQMDKAEATFTIPASKCGIVIGRGGETIKQINRLSGAHCELDRRPAPNPKEKVFLIRGMPDQIEHAKRIISEKIGMPPGPGGPTATQYPVGQGPPGGQGPPQYFAPQGLGGYQPWQGQQHPQDPNAAVASAAGTGNPGETGQVQVNPQTGQPDYNLQWAEYYRSLGMHREADMFEHQAKKMQRPQQQPPQQQPQQQPPAQPNIAQNGQSDYSAQWAENSRSIEKIKLVEAIEASMKTENLLPKTRRNSHMKPEKENKDKKLVSEEETKDKNLGSQEETKDKKLGSEEETKDKRLGSEDETKDKKLGSEDETKDKKLGSEEDTENEKLSWEDAAKFIQQEYLEAFGDRDWDGYKQTELKLLERNIGFALYGPPEELPEKEDVDIGYSKKKVDVITKLASLIKEYCKPDTLEFDVIVATIFVILNSSDQVISIPVFRVPKYSDNKVDSVVFIDSDLRVYKDWDDYLQHNRLPPCTYCYPKNGEYMCDEDGKVCIEFNKTPSSHVGKKVLKVLDYSSTAVAVGAAVVGLASLATLPVAAPVVLASTVGNAMTFLYGTGRSIESLVDKKKHGQNIGLDDSEARTCYLSMVGGALSVASGAGVKAISYFARSGEVVGKTAKGVVTALNVSSLVANGAGIINSGFLLGEHYVETGTLSPLEIFQFSSSILFFTHSLVNVKTADAIFREEQKNVMKEFESSLRSNRQRKVFRRLARQTASEQDQMTRNAKVIKSITHIDNPDDFFSSLVKIRRDIHECKTNMAFSERGLVEINGQVEVHSAVLNELHADQRRVILQVTRDTATNIQSITDVQRFVGTTSQNLQNIELGMNSSDNQVSVRNDSKLSAMLREIKIDFRSFVKCMRNIDSAYYEIILNIALQIAESLGWGKEAELIIRISRFVYSYATHVAFEMECKYQDDLQIEKLRLGDSFNQQDFDNNYNISGNRGKHFISIILQSYNLNRELLLELQNAYQVLFGSRTTGRRNNSNIDTDSTNTSSVESLQNISTPDTEQLSTAVNTVNSDGASTSQTPVELERKNAIKRASTRKSACSSPSDTLESQYQFLKHCDFTKPHLSRKDIVEIIFEITGMVLTETDIFVSDDGNTVTVQVTNQHSLLSCVMIYKFLELNLIGANAFYYDN